MPKNNKQIENTTPEKTKSNADSAVIMLGSKQYFVKVGEKIEVELTGDKDTVSTPDLLMAKTVKLKKIEDIKGPKISIIKFKNKTRYLRRIGHRQKYTILEVQSIT